MKVVNLRVIKKLNNKTNFIIRKDIKYESEEFEVD